MKIIAFTGMPLSGKSEAVQMIKEDNIPVVRMGDMVWEETKRQGLELTDANVGHVATTMRKSQGKDIWAQKTLETIKKMQPTDLLVIDGIRNHEEVDFFKHKLGSTFHLIAIVASDTLRKKRALSRKRKDDTQTEDQFMMRDKRELGWGLGEVIASADEVIVNEGSLQEFQQHIKKLLERI